MPAISYACRYNFFIYPEMISPIRKGFCFSFYGDKVSASSISHLLTTGSPFAIIRLVVSRVVYTLKRVIAFGPSAYIIDEIGERHPSFAYSYSTTAIMPVNWMIRIVAALFHSFPNSIFGPIASAVLGDNARFATVFLCEFWERLTAALANKRGSARLFLHRNSPFVAVPRLLEAARGNLLVGLL